MAEEPLIDERAATLRARIAAIVFAILNAIWTIAKWYSQVKSEDAIIPDAVLAAVTPFILWVADRTGRKLQILYDSLDDDTKTIVSDALAGRSVSLGGSNEPTNDDPMTARDVHGTNLTINIPRSLARQHGEVA